MINPDVAKDHNKHCALFNAEKPFKHIVLDNFFTVGVAHDLLQEFPKFEDKYALNELGKVGGKAVITDIKNISSSYKSIYRYLNSKEFLQSIEDITGIKNLIADPKMYGGGTHENTAGQELDAHIDYNYINGGNLHRRLNLILYLNKEWEPDWGGSIELHSNPRKPNDNVIKSVLPLYNRVLIFETNEHSWHGFTKIQLPTDKQHLTRKSLAIYLYTTERPKEEIAPHHTTFYVQRPLPEYIKEGFTLDTESVTAIKELLTRRDSMIEFYQKTTLQQTPSLARMMYLALPIPSSIKITIKECLFKYFSFAFKHSVAYRNWATQKGKK